MATDQRSESAKRFVTTTIEVEGREETKVVEVPAFEPEPWGEDASLTVVGQRVERVDAMEKTTGRAVYTADVRRPGMVYAMLVRSTIARGKAMVDVSAVRAHAGVLDVLTAAEIAGTLGGPASRLFDTNVSYVGQPLAAVCAETRGAAWAAASLVRITYDELPHVLTYESATAAGAPTVRGNASNLALGSPLVRQRGDIEAGLAAAQVTITITVRTPCALHSALEPHGAVAEWEGERLSVWESTQGVFRVRNGLAGAFKLPHTHVRVQCDFMGGGFGAKSSAGPHTFTAALFAKRLQLPVRCVLDREGEQIDTGNRPSSEQVVTLGATQAGRLTAIRLDARVALGVMGWEGGPAKIYHEMYSCPNVHTTERFALINASAMQAFRAPGHVEGAFGLERAMDVLARKVGIDPLALRLANVAEHDEEKERPWSGNRLRECYAQGAKRFGWVSKGGKPTRKAGATTSAAAAPDTLAGTAASSRVRRGVGVAAQSWGTGGGPPAYALCRINSDGTATVLTGTQDLGTGVRTVLTQVAAEALGMKVNSLLIL